MFNISFFFILYIKIGVNTIKNIGERSLSLGGDHNKKTLTCVSCLYNEFVVVPPSKLLYKFSVHDSNPEYLYLAEWKYSSRRSGQSTILLMRS